MIYNDSKKFYIFNIFRNNMLKLKLLQINNILQNICIRISDSKKSAGLHIFQFLYNWRTSYKFNQYTILNKNKKKKLNKKSNKKRNISVFKFFNIFTKNSQNDAYIFLKHNQKIETINNQKKKNPHSRTIDLI